MQFKSILFITTIWLAVLFSGCVADNNVTESVNLTPVITATSIATPLLTPTPQVTSTGNEIQVKLDGSRGFIPNNQTITAGDEVVWDNFDPVTLTLVSKDGLFEDKPLAYYQQFRYVFEKTGNYTLSLKNKNLTGTIVVVSYAIPRPSPYVTQAADLPFNTLYVSARMKSLSNWTTGNEVKYGLDQLNVKVINQINTPLMIKAQIISGDVILEEKTFNLEKQDSSVEFSNEKNHFIKETSVNLRLFVKGYPPVEYKFIEVDQLN